MKPLYRLFAAAIAAQIGGVMAAVPQGNASLTVVANGRNWLTADRLRTTAAGQVQTTVALFQAAKTVETRAAKRRVTARRRNMAFIMNPEIWAMRQQFARGVKRAGGLRESNQ